MNKILKDDVLELLKRYKRAKTDKEKIQCANDFSNIFDAANEFNSDINFKAEIPGELAIILNNLEVSLKEERDNLTKQIYDHLDELEEIYLAFINEILKYDYRKRY